jgi:isocitrate dehydrogenase
MMLVHIGQNDVATNVHNAWLKTMEDGVHTYDIYRDGVSHQKVGTQSLCGCRDCASGSEAFDPQAR